MEEKQFRCFGTGKKIYEKYHDQEWGIPVYDDQCLFEMLCLETAQAGLRWETILEKRHGYRRVFHQFHIDTIAKMSEEELEKILENPAVIRNRRKIFSVRQNACVVQKIQLESGSFSRYLWEFVDHKPIIHNFKSAKEIPNHCSISDSLAQDLKKRGMCFVGTITMYAFMQAVGMVNDHLVDCPRHKACGLL